MKGRILRPGLVAIQYRGEIDIPFRAAVENKKYPIVSTNDIVLVSEVTAITYCRGTQWRKLDSDLDLMNLSLRILAEFVDIELFERVATDFKMGQLVDDTIKKVNSSNKETHLREATLENLNNLNEAEIKTACKKYGIKIGRKKVEDLIPLLIPFLEQENQA